MFCNFEINRCRIFYDNNLWNNISNLCCQHDCRMDFWFTATILMLNNRFSPVVSFMNNTLKLVSHVLYVKMLSLYSFVELPWTSNVLAPLIKVALSAPDTISEVTLNLWAVFSQFSTGMLIYFDFFASTWTVWAQTWIEL